MSRDYLIRLRDMLGAATKARAYATGIPDAATLAAEHPEKILKEFVDPSVGFQSFQARKLAFGLGLEGKVVNEAVPEPSPAAAAVTVTAPGVNVERTATLHMPPSADSSWSSGEW